MKVSAPQGQKRAYDWHAALTCTLPFAGFSFHRLHSKAKSENRKSKTKMLEHAIPKTHEVKWGGARWASFQAEQRGFFNKHAAAAQRQGHFRFVQARHE
jgi:hypothetical protein